MNKKYSIGLDFGTLSGRAVIVDCDNGDEISACSFDYPHGVIDECLPDGKTYLPPDFALQHPSDYIDTLKYIIPNILKSSNISPDNVIGVGIDFTACTLIPVYSDGTPLCYKPEYYSNPHAYVKLWKHHAAQPYAELFNKIALERKEKWIAGYGGKISSEWLFPKILEIINNAPEIYNDADYFIEAGDWLVWQLCGKQTRNSCCAGYKGFWNKRNGYPDNEYLKSVDKRLDNVVKLKLDCPVSSVGTKAGVITPEAAKLTGLRAGTAVSLSNIDAHATFPSLGISEPGKMLMIMGTSSCQMMISKTEIIFPGICGVVEDGIIPGYYGYEAGQCCVGDHFNWFVNNLVPESYKTEAAINNKNIYKYLNEKAENLKAGESGVIALDWWNGNRSVLVDFNLTGLFIGMTLQTKPEALYRALIEATAYGAKKIIDTFGEYGINSDELYAAGGIAEKDPFTMQIYADILGLDIKISGSPQAAALGSAIFGAVAAGVENGGYSNITEASLKMGKVKDVTYKPDAKNHKIYNELYKEYLLLHDYFGKGGNDVMKRLKAIKKSVI